MSLLNTPQAPRNEVINPMSSGLFRTIPLAAVILGFAVTAFYYGQLPAKIPIHFGVGGKADSFGPKLILWLIPAINLALFYGLEAATKTSYKWFNYPVTITEENTTRQHNIALQLIAVTRLVVCLMISFIVYSIVKTALAGEAQINMLIMGLFLIALFGSIGYFTWRAKSSS
ncbi:MAG: putative membrane protein [Neolewinella sp.]|jgi:uncharacterized membrane protein